MRAPFFAVMASLGFLVSAIQAQAVKVSILVDLDPVRVDRSVIVESMTADARGTLYLPDRVSGNILRVEAKSPTPVVVGRIAERQIDGKSVGGNGGGIAFDAQGDVFIATAPFSEVVRIRKADLDPD